MLPGTGQARPAGGRGFVAAGDAASHDGDHGTVEVGLVAFGQALAVTDAPPVFHDPPERALHDPGGGAAPGRHAGCRGA